MAILADVTEIAISTDRFDGADTIGIDDFTFKPFPIPEAVRLSISGLIGLVGMKNTFKR